MKKVLIFIALALIFVLAASVWQATRPKPQETIVNEQEVEDPEQSRREIHYHAGFQVYHDDTLKDFSLLEYMHIEPCTEEEHEAETPSAEEEQIEKAHLHDFVPDVVHVHREGSTWQDLFTNLGYPIDPTAAYVNGEKVDNILNSPIRAYDSAVFFAGTNTDIEGKLQKAVNREHIEATEAEGESC